MILRRKFIRIEKFLLWVLNENILLTEPLPKLSEFPHHLWTIVKAVSIIFVRPRKAAR